MTVGRASCHFPVQALVLGVAVATAAMCTRDAEAQNGRRLTVPPRMICRLEVSVFLNGVQVQ